MALQLHRCVEWKHDALQVVFTRPLEVNAGTRKSRLQPHAGRGSSSSFLRNEPANGSNANASLLDRRNELPRNFVAAPHYSSLLRLNRRRHHELRMETRERVFLSMSDFVFRRVTDHLVEIDPFTVNDGIIEERRAGGTHVSTENATGTSSADATVTSTSPSLFGYFPPGFPRGANGAALAAAILLLLVALITAAILALRANKTSTNGPLEASTQEASTAGSVTNGGARESLEDDRSATLQESGDLNASYFDPFSDKADIGRPRPAGGARESLEDDRSATLQESGDLNASYFDPFSDKADIGRPRPAGGARESLKDDRSATLQESGDLNASYFDPFSDKAVIGRPRPAVTSSFENQSTSFRPIPHYSTALEQSDLPLPPSLSLSGGTKGNTPPPVGTAEDIDPTPTPEALPTEEIDPGPTQEGLATEEVDPAPTAEVLNSTADDQTVSSMNDDGPHAVGDQIPLPEPDEMQTIDEEIVNSNGVTNANSALEVAAVELETTAIEEMASSALTEELTAGASTDVLDSALMEQSAHESVVSEPIANFPPPAAEQLSGEFSDSEYVLIGDSVSLSSVKELSAVAERNAGAPTAFDVGVSDTASVDDSATQLPSEVVGVLSDAAQERVSAAQERVSAAQDVELPDSTSVDHSAVAERNAGAPTAFDVGVSDTASVDDSATQLPSEVVGVLSDAAQERVSAAQEERVSAAQEESVSAGSVTTSADPEVIPDRRKEYARLLEKALPAMSVGAGLAALSSLSGVDGALQVVGVFAAASLLTRIGIWAGPRQQLVDDIRNIKDHKQLVLFLKDRDIIPEAWNQ